MQFDQMFRLGIDIELMFLYNAATIWEIALDIWDFLPEA